MVCPGAYSSRTRSQASVESSERKRKSRHRPYIDGHSSESTDQGSSPAELPQGWSDCPAEPTYQGDRCRNLCRVETTRRSRCGIVVGSRLGTTLSYLYRSAENSEVDIGISLIADTESCNRSSSPPDLGNRRKALFNFTRGTTGQRLSVTQVHSSSLTVRIVSDSSRGDTGFAKAHRRWQGPAIQVL